MSLDAKVMLHRAPTDAPPPDGRVVDDAALAARVAARAERLAIDPERLEKDLARLVLTLVELLRQVMESQAVHRMERGSLSDDEIERLGTALLAAKDKVEELREAFGLAPEDLNLDLGPLGTLL